MPSAVFDLDIGGILRSSYIDNNNQNTIFVREFHCRLDVDRLKIALRDI